MFRPSRQPSAEVQPMFGARSVTPVKTSASAECHNISFGQSLPRPIPGLRPWTLLRTAVSTPSEFSTFRLKLASPFEVSGYVGYLSQALAQI